jgi:hypothetical protein
MDEEGEIIVVGDALGDWSKPSSRPPSALVVQDP